MAFGSRSRCRNGPRHRNGITGRSSAASRPTSPLEGRSRSTSPSWGGKVQRRSSIGRASRTATTPIRAPVLRNRSIGRSAANLAAAVSTAPGTKRVKGPSNVTLGGHPAKYVVLKVRENVGCNPGFFYTWQQVHGGEFWSTSASGDTIRVWIVKVYGRLSLHPSRDKPGSRVAQQGGAADRPIDPVRRVSIDSWRTSLCRLSGVVVVEEPAQVLLRFGHELPLRVLRARERWRDARQVPAKSPNVREACRVTMRVEAPNRSSQATPRRRGATQLRQQAVAHPPDVDDVLSSVRQPQLAAQP